MPIHFLRHAQSEFNAGLSNVKDSPLSPFGKEQSLGVHGKYDLVIVSTLKRAQQTLYCSQIEYTKVIKTDLCRELRGGALCDYLESEEVVLESHQECHDRKQKFIGFLQAYENEYNNILVISHACFISYFIGRGHVGNCELVTYSNS